MKILKVLATNFTGNTIVVTALTDEGVKTKITPNTHPNWALVLSLYKAGRYLEMFPALDVSEAIRVKFHGNFSVKDGRVFYRDQPVGGYLIDQILFFMQSLPNQAERLIRFAENLYKNPSPEVIEQLYRFLEHKNMPITDDGCFLAYKGVGMDYYSRTAGDIKVLVGKVKDGRIFNGIGEPIVVERKQVCDNSGIGCARGIHVGSWEYANDFKGDGHLMVVKVNPKDAVSVPDDCNWSKLRACAYVVIAEEGRKLHAVKDINFDKVVEVRQKFSRDSLGRFSKYHRDENGRFASKP